MGHKENGFKQQQQQQHKLSFSKDGSNLNNASNMIGSKQQQCYHHHHHHEGAFLGISKLTLAVAAACILSFFYILTIMLTSGSSSTSICARAKNVLYICQSGGAAECEGRKIGSAVSSSRSSPGNVTGSAVPSTTSKEESVPRLELVVAKSPNLKSPNESSGYGEATTTRATSATSATGTTTSLAHIVFGIAASSRLWERRREYVKLWWRPSEMRGFVWMDRKVRRWSKDYPTLRISSSTDRFNYTNKLGSKAAIRISRVVSETFRQGLDNVHWYVMGDDDTFFIPENLVRVLSKYDHRRYHYIGSTSESHTQNLHFSYNMAYGGGGFAISAPLAAALERTQDACLHRYPYLFGSDDRIHACMAELGIPLTKEPGFHQFDIYGDALGLLAAHPVAPLVTLHHLDVISPIFPNMTQAKAIQHLRRAIRTDPGGVLQQSICYDKWRKWSFSVSWGYAVQVFRGILPPRELELPARTFLSWYRRTEDSGFPFSTRAVSRDPCEQPTVFYMQSVSSRDPGSSSSIYVRESKKRGDCKWRMASPAGVEWIRVVKEQTDKSWHQAPRRQCCRVKNSNRKNVEIEVGACRFGEFIA